MSRICAKSRPYRRSGFTLVELMVVIAIVAILAWIGFGLIGVLRGTDPLDEAVTLIKASITQGRSQAVASGSSFTLLVDWENNRLVPVVQKSVATFSFETGMGSYGRFVALGRGAAITNRQADNTIDDPRHSGECLDLPTGGTARIPFGGEFSRTAGVDGMAVRFRIYPMPYGVSSGVLMAAGGAGVWRIDINTTAAGDSRLLATIPGGQLEAEIPLAPYAWSEVELSYSPILVQLAINGIVSSMPASFDPSSISSHAPEILIGSATAPHVLIDELRLDTVSISAPVVPGSAMLLPPLFNGEALIRGDSPWLPQFNESGEPMLPLPPLPIAPAASYDPSLGVPRRGLIVFDSRGQLNSSLHTGQVTLDLVARYPDGEVRQIEVGIAPLGGVTSQRVPVRRLSSFELPPEVVQPDTTGEAGE